MSAARSAVAEVPDRPLESWEHYRKTIFEEEVKNDLDEPAAYRGMSNDSWSLLSSLDRLFGHLKEVDRDRVADDAATIFGDLAVHHGVRREAPMGERLAIGQHWGLPTRLLDWTLSPYIAAYFAFSSYVRRPHIDRSSADRVAIWKLDLAGDQFKPKTSDLAGDVIEIIRTNPEISPRLHAQKGLFTLNKTGLPLVEALHQKGAVKLLTKLTVPATDAWVALQDLRLMGIDDASMFPDLQGAALAAMTRLVSRWGPAL